MFPSIDAFYDELSKIAFDLQQAKKVLQIAKAKQLPKASHRMVGRVMGELGGASGLVNEAGKSGLTAIPAGRSARRATNKMLKPVTQAASGTQFEEPLRQQTQTQLGMQDAFNRNLRGKSSIVPGYASPQKQFADMERMSGSPKEMLGLLAPKGMTPEQHQMFGAVAKGHELDELAAKPSLSAMGEGHRKGLRHRNMDVIMKEHNRLVTLPKGFDPVRVGFRNLRDVGREGVDIKKVFPNFQYGQSPRLSRHAQRRMSEVLNRRNLEGLQQTFQPAPPGSV